MTTDGPRDLAGVAAWLRGHGFWLEHETAEALKAARFYPRLGQVYTDLNGGKLRDIDVIAEPYYDPSPYLALKLRAVFECKAGKLGAWVVRQTTAQDDEIPWPIATERAATFLREHARLLRGVFELYSAIGFAVLEAGKKPDAAYNAMQQAVSAARGVTQGGGSTFAYPVVVVDAPVFGLSHDADTDELVEMPWARVLFSGAHQLGGPTLVDVVGRAGLPEYLPTLHTLLSNLSASMLQSGWKVDE